MQYLDKILKKAEKEHDNLKHPYVGTEHLLLALLSEENELTDKLKEYKLTYNKFKRKLKDIIGEGTTKSPYILYTPMLRKVINNAENSVSDVSEITNNDLFKAICDANEGIAIRIIETMDIDINEINVLSNDYMKIDENMIITNRDRECEEILQILMRKNKCNPILIGDAGVGKTAIVEEIQRRLLKNEVPSYLKGYKIVDVDMASLVAGTKYRGDFESKVNDLLKRVEKERVILFIDEIHTLVHAGGAEGAISAGDIIKPYLARGKIKCIGATTINEYHEYFEKDEALNRRFQKIVINEPDLLTTINILQSIKSNYEKYHKLAIDNNLIDEIAYVANKYLINKRNPDKSIELLDSCCTNAKFNEQENVTLENLYNIFEYRYGINLSNNSIKNILDNKSIILTDIDNINKINNLNYNILNIDGKNYNNDDDIYNLLGNPIYKNNSYLLKSAIDIPIGVITIINYNCNEVLKEFIEKLINNRKIIDNLGNSINFINYIIVMENINNNSSLGFINDIKYSDNKLNFIPLDEKILLPSI